MFGIHLGAAVLAAIVLYGIALPILQYFRDSKGLRRYPGFTPLAGFSDLPYCWLSACGFRSRDLYELHKEHPILRLGPNSLSFGRVRAIKDIYGHSTKCAKDKNYEILGGTHAHLIDVVAKSQHAQKRKLMSAAFAIKNLERWEYKVADVTARLIAVLDGKCTSPLTSEKSIPDPGDVNLDFNALINLWTIEAINNIALSARMGLIEKESDWTRAERMDGTLYHARYRQAQNQTSYAQSVFAWDYKHYKLLEWVSRLSPKFSKVWEEAAPWNDVVYHQVMERLRRHQAGETLDDDFFSSLMNNKSGNPNNLEWGEIVSEISVIINAGADTTAIALTHIMELLLRHPDVLKKLRHEIDEALDDEDVVAPYDKIKDLPYLKACLDEGLRLIPPTSAGLMRRTPKDGCQIQGHWIPGDTSVSMTIYAAHRDPEIFPDPETFNPERWVDVDSRKKMEPYFIPFSTGARGCIGRNISYLEQFVVVASLLHRFEFALPSATFQLERFEAFNILVGALPLKIWRRQMPTES